MQTIGQTGKTGISVYTLHKLDKNVYRHVQVRPLRPHETASGLRHISPGYTQTGQRVLAVMSSTNHKEADIGGAKDICLWREGR